MRLISFIIITSASLALSIPLLETLAIGSEVHQTLKHRAALPDDTSSAAGSVPPSLQDCLAAKNIPTFYTTSEGFSQLAEPYNLRLAYTPAVIVVAREAGDIEAAVRCAAASNVKVQAKSGGHSYASFSSGGQNGSMVIDLQVFQEITVGGDYFQAKVGAGVRIGNLALALYDQNQRAMPHATVPGVGIGGHATHGGYGYTSRMWGLTLDTFIGADVVLANGTYLHTTAKQYPDTYYALRGAADSIGIVVFFYFQTKPAPSEVVNWSYTIPDMYVSAATSATVFQNIQNFALNPTVVDRKLGFG